MKKMFLTICALGLFSSMQAQPLDRSVRPKPGPAPTINLKDATTFTLPNGLKVFVVENHKMPIVTYSIQLDIKPELERNKVGLHDFVGELLTRGTQSMNKDAFDNAIDEIGGQISASGTSVSGVSLSKYQDQLLSLMSDALLHPAFSQDQLDKVVKQTESGLISDENDADNMLSNVSGVVNFGTTHPYGEVMTPQTVKNVSLNDCKQYYNEYFRPNVAYLAVVGDITPEQAKALVTKYFGSWQKQEVKKSTYTAAAAPAQTQVDFANRPGAVQSVIGITYPINLPIGSPDVIKAQAMNQILGGGSTSKLFLNLREKHGWTYGAYSTVSPDELIGNVQLYAKCRNEVTDSSITQMLAEMDTIRNQPVSEETLQGVRNYMSGVFALQLESPQTIARYAINIDRYNMPKDYYKNYLKNVAAVTPADVQAMAQKYILPGKAHIVVVGNSSQLNKLKKFSTGEMKFYDNFGNETQPIEDKVINGKNMDAILQMYINAIGGKAAIEGLTDLTQTGDLNMNGQNVGKVTIMTSTPDKYLQEFSPKSYTVNGDRGEIDVVGGSSSQGQKVLVNGDQGYMSMGGKKMDLTGEALTPYKEKADLQSILHPDKYGVSYSLLDMSDVNGTPAFQVSKVSENGKSKALVYFDAATGLLLKVTENKNEGGRMSLTDTYYSNYKEVKNGNGYKVPFTIKIDRIGQGSQDIMIRSAKANSGIKPNKFK